MVSLQPLRTKAASLRAQRARDRTETPMPPRVSFPWEEAARRRRQLRVYFSRRLREPLKSAELEESVAGIFLQGHEIGAFSYVRQVV
jgi:hypothetical protein